MSRAPWRHRRRGIALPSILFALLVIGTLGSTIFMITDLHGRTIINRERSIRAMHLAEAGVSHAVGVIRTALPDTALSRILLGPDRAANTADDGLLTGWGMAAGVGIPAAGVTTSEGTYFVQMKDDAVDPTPNPFDDGNSRVTAVCRGVTTDGATATAEVLLGVTPFPAMGVNGPLGVSGSPVTIRGECGDAHANGVVTVSGSPQVEGELSSSTTVVGAGLIDDMSGNPNPPLQNQPPLEIPTLNPADYCAAAQFVLRADGTIVKRGNPDQSFNGITGAFGWKRSSSSPVIWVADGNPIAPGTICVEGNLELSGAVGSAATPLALSIVATGSVQISGNPYLTSFDPRGIGIIAGGDVKISGNPTAGANSYNGLIYAGAQCQVSGNPVIQGSVLCNDGPLPAGGKDMVAENLLNGNATIRYECGGLLAGQRRVLFWFQQLNK